MSAPNYGIFPIDLSIARTQSKVVEVGVRYSSVTILQLPAGATVALAFGSNKQDVPLLTQAQTFDMCPASDEGLTVTNPAGAGIVILFVAYDDVVASA